MSGTSRSRTKGDANSYVELADAGNGLVKVLLLMRTHTPSEQQNCQYLAWLLSVPIAGSNPVACTIRKPTHDFFPVEIKITVTRPASWQRPIVPAIDR